MSIRRAAKAAFALLAGFASAQEPCAELSSASSGGLIPASLALQCLRSVPLQTQTVLSQLQGLELLVGFQSDLAYLNNSEPARLVQDDYYSNEYDFQADLARLFASAYDGHLTYIPDIVGAFVFARLAPSGNRFPLISVSSDGLETPEIYAYDDRYVLAVTNARATFVPSMVSQIDGQDVEDFLNQHAALSGTHHDPDSNYNLLFPNELAPSSGTTFEEFRFFNESNQDQTRLTFENGTETVLDIRAISNVDYSGVTDGASFFGRCCNGSIMDTLSASLGAEQGVALSELRKPLSVTTLSNVDRARPRLRQPQLTKRQFEFPEEFISVWNNTIAGYFPEAEPDLAVLTIPTFEVAFARILDFQSTIADFLLAASEAGKTRLIIDLRGNPGGINFFAHDTFRQIFPTGFPYDAVNYRANPLFDFTGRVISQNFSNIDVENFDNPLTAPAFFAGAYPFNYRQQLDENNSTFESWEDLFGPAENQSIGNFTSLVRPNLTNTFQTLLPVYPVGRTAAGRSRLQVFDAGNITLLQDGGCASTCALFTEFMKSNAPGDQQVRQVVVGGRRQDGPMQGVGAVKGGQLGLMIALGQAVSTAVSSASLADIMRFQVEFSEEDIAAAVVALDRASIIAGDGDLLPGLLPAASVNFRNAIREGDESRTPLQYVYDAADCRVFYTAQMYTSQEALWRKVYDVSWNEGECVSGSTEHPSAQFGTNYEDIEVPEQARSSFTIRMSGDVVASGPSASGGENDGSSGSQENGDGDESEAMTVKTHFVGTLLVALVVVVLVIK